MHIRRRNGVVFIGLNLFFSCYFHYFIRLVLPFGSGKSVSRWLCVFDSSVCKQIVRHTHTFFRLLLLLFVHIFIIFDELCLCVFFIFLYSLNRVLSCSLVCISIIILSFYLAVSPSVSVCLFIFLWSDFEYFFIGFVGLWCASNS